MGINCSRVALVIGINGYEEENIQNLDKALNDAKAIAKKLKEFGFNVITGFDVTSTQFDDLKNQYENILKSADVGVFYFAGHGVEIDGENVLFVKDSKTSKVKDTLKRYSIILQDVIDDFHPLCKANIFIVDACRNVIKEIIRGQDSVKIAPIRTPQGTLIAFSTSPGETAGDGKNDCPNSNYTTALLNHLDDKGIEIERLFKKVRETLYHMTNGKQTSWEHTSLIGNIILNPNNNRSVPDITYGATATADSQWNDPVIADILDGFKSHTYQYQNSAIDTFKERTAYSPDQSFVIGRNILQSSMGGAWKCQSFLSSVRSIRSYNEPGGNNHVLNGILYEIYFDNNGQFRGHNLKCDDLHWLINIIKDGRFIKSLEFINAQLQPYSDKLLFTPSPNLKNIEMQVFGKNISDDFGDVYEISEIVVNGQSILTDNMADSNPNGMFIRKDEIEDFQNGIAKLYGIPKDLIKWSYIEVPKPDVTIKLKKSLRII